MEENKNKANNKENLGPNKLPAIDASCLHKKTNSEPDLRELNRLPPINFNQERSRRQAHHLDSPVAKRRRIIIKDKLNLLHPLKQLKRIIEPRSIAISIANKSMQENLEQIQKHSIKTAAATKAIKQIATFFLTEYTVKHNSTNSVSTALINAHNPTFLGYQAYEEAMLAISTSKYMLELITELHNTVKIYIQKANDQFKRRETIIILIQKINKEQELCKELFNNCNERFTASMLSHYSERLIHNAIKQKCIENNPELAAREEHTSLNKNNRKILSEIESHMPNGQIEILKDSLKQIQTAENIVEGTSRLEKIHAAALEPKTLLLQYDSSRYKNLKLKLLLELAENKGLPLLFKTLTHMRTEIFDIVPDAMQDEIKNQINIAELVGSVASQSTEANIICKRQFTYLYNIIISRLAEQEQVSFSKIAAKLNQHIDQITSIVSILPEYIILILEAINKIGESRLKLVLNNKPGIVQQDMLELEASIFANKIQSYLLTFDATSLWLEKLFKQANTNNITDYEKYSSKASLHIINAGLLQLLTANTINRSTLADTLFLDYSRLKQMQHIQYQLIIKLISHQTILSIFKQEKITFDNDSIQSTINGSAESLYISFNKYINNLTTMLKYELKSNSIDEIIQQRVLDNIKKLISAHCDQDHRLYQLFHKRVSFIIKRKLQTGCLDMSILKQPELKSLYNDFSASFSDKLTTLINTHMKVHTKLYQHELPLLQAQEFIHKITHQYFLPNNQLPPNIGSLDSFSKLSLRLNKIALLSTYMSLTVQFINNLKQKINHEVTAADITNHIQAARADILFKRKNYTHAQIVEHILEYRKLPLLNKQKINLHKIFNFLQQTSIKQCLDETTSDQNMLTALFILNLKQLFQNHNIEIDQPELLNLSNQIKSIKPYQHPGFKMYQTACRSILLEFCANNHFELRHKRKWAALSLFHDPLKQLATAVKQLLTTTGEIADQHDQQQAHSLIPQQLKTGFK